MVIYHHCLRTASPSAAHALRPLVRGLASVAIVLAWSGCLASESVGSVGAVLGRDPQSGALHLREVPDGMAAADAGLEEGDRVKMIDGILVDELDASRIQALLRGPVGSTVTLTIVRGAEVRHAEVTRQAFAKPPKLEDGEERIE